MRPGRELFPTECGDRQTRAMCKQGEQGKLAAGRRRRICNYGQWWTLTRPDTKTLIMETSKSLSAAALLISLAAVARAEEPGQYAQRAREVTEHIQKNFFDPQSGVYFKSMTLRKPDYVWLQSVMFSNLVAAARSEPATYAPLLDKYFMALDSYWDSKVKIPGYEAAPTRGNGNDKYYDDNAWLVITFLEACETNHDPRYLTRADETLKFV